MLSDEPTQLRSRPLRPFRRVYDWLFGFGHRYADPLDQQRAQALAAMCLIFGIMGAFGIVGLALLFPGVIPEGLIIPNFVFAALYLVLYWLVQRGQLRLASFLFVIVAQIVPAVQSVPHGFMQPEAVTISFAVPVLTAALLLGPSWALVTAVTSTVCIGVLTYLQISQQAVDLSLLSIISHGRVIVSFMVVFLLGVVALFAWLSASSLYRWAFDAQRRARQLEAAAVISETAATAPNVNVLLNLVAERIRAAYGFYHAQVFLVDREGRLARLEASTGRAGEALLARGHALPVGSQSVVGQCTYHGEPVVVNDTSRSATHRPNELLPDTRAELALPLLIGSEVIGAIDVQSTEPDVFQPEDIRSLQIMTSQLATTVEKARLVDELQTRAAENQRLLEEAQQNLRQIEELSRRMTREGWSDYLRARRIRGTLGYTLHDTEVRQDSSWTAPMRQAYQGERSVVIEQAQQAHIAAVPLRVRGEVIGVLEIERDGDHPWTDAELEMAETLVERLSLAVENARLFEQATLAAEREHIVNEIAQSVQEAETIDQVLQSALAELSNVLGASRGIVQISPKADLSGEDMAVLGDGT